MCRVVSTIAFTFLGSKRWTLGPWGAFSDNPKSPCFWNRSLQSRTHKLSPLNLYVPSWVKVAPSVFLWYKQKEYGGNHGLGATKPLFSHHQA